MPSVDKLRHLSATFLRSAKIFFRNWIQSLDRVRYFSETGYHLYKHLSPYNGASVRVSGSDRSHG